MILLLFVLHISFMLTGIPTLIALVISKIAAMVNGNRINIISLANRTFWFSWSINSVLYFLLTTNNVMFGRTHASESLWTVFFCSLVVVSITYIGYQTLKMPIEEES